MLWRVRVLLLVATLLSLPTGCQAQPPAVGRPAGDSRSDAPVAVIDSRGGRVRLFIVGMPRSVGRDQLVAWATRAADAVGSYLGRSPVRRVDLIVTVGGSGRVGGGKELDGRRIELRLGDDVTERDLERDWVLTHEMFHLAFPDLGQKYAWMNEGLSDYLEPIARARVGQLLPEQVWREWVRGLPLGLPQRDDRGLDNTHTWARTYWGGTLFWLLADVRIRRETGNRKSVDDVVRAVLAAGGDGSKHWDIARVIDVGDRATATHVLRDLHEELGQTPAAPDLRELWRQLGVVYARGRVNFDDSAPLSGIRRGITARNP